MRELVDARERDDDQRDQQHGAEAEREGGAGHEIMSVPEGEQRRRPRRRPMLAAAASSHRLPQRSPRLIAKIGSDSSTLSSKRDAGELPVIGIGDRAGPGEFRLARGVE